MAWIYLAESEESHAPYCRGCDQSPTVKTTNTLRQYCYLGWHMAPFLPRLSGTMCEHSNGIGIYHGSTLSLEVSPARISARQELERAWQASEADWFSRSLDSQGRSSRRLSSWRMCRLLGPVGQNEWSKNWPRSGMHVDGIVYPLMMWGRRTKEKDGRRDRIKALGNAVVPQQAREAFERLMGLK